MADKDFDFDNFLTTKKDKQTGVALSNTSKAQTTRDTENTRNTRTTTTTNNTRQADQLHPFSIRLDEHYVETIKAFAWWERVSQRKWIENCIESLLAEYGQDKIDQIRLKFREESE